MTVSKPMPVLPTVVRILLLLATARRSSVSAGALRKLDTAANSVDVLLTFDPPLRWAQYHDGFGCVGDEEDRNASSAVVEIQHEWSIRWIHNHNDREDVEKDGGWFCARQQSSPTGDNGGDDNETVYHYTRIEIVDCHTEGYVDRRSVCTDATCHDCQEAAPFASTRWIGYGGIPTLELPGGLDGYCFDAIRLPQPGGEQSKATPAFAATAGAAVFPTKTSFRFTNDTFLGDAAARTRFLWEHSCLGDLRTSLDRHEKDPNSYDTTSKDDNQPSSRDVANGSEDETIEPFRHSLRDRVTPSTRALQWGLISAAAGVVVGAVLAWIVFLQRPTAAGHGAAVAPLEPPGTKRMATTTTTTEEPLTTPLEETNVRSTRILPVPSNIEFEVF